MFRSWLLAAVGVPFLLLGLRILPPLRDHLDGRVHAHPWAQLRETFNHANHLRAFALTFAIMFGGFSVIPYISLYLVGNVGVTEQNLTWVYVTGGLLTLVGAPLIGRLADRFGKLSVYRVVASVAACLMLVVTTLTPVPLALAVGVVGALMLCNAGRMVAGLAIVTGSVEQRRRGGFMSANSAVQHSGVWSRGIRGRQDHRVGGGRRAAAFWQGRDHGDGGDLADALAGWPGAIAGESSMRKADCRVPICPANSRLTGFRSCHSSRLRPASLW